MGEIMKTLEVIVVGSYALFDERLNDVYQEARHLGMHLIGKKHYYNEEDRRYETILDDKSKE
jgi:hypothetical protein